jgi:uncharacterized SAM-binding protein YcdF (DUF218 family)
MRHFALCYWTFSKHFGRRVWETRGRESMSALLLAFVTFVVSLMFRQVDSVTALEIALLSLVGWLCIFAFGHLIHTPVVLLDGRAQSKARSQHWGFGILGVLILAIIAASITAVGMWWWIDRAPKIAIPDADQGALRPLIESQKQQIAGLKARIPDERSLKVRSLEAADDFGKFWKRQPKEPVCNQTGLTPEQQQKAIQPCVEFFNKRTLLYQQVLAPRVMAIVAEFKAKGANVSNIENCAAMAYCGIPMVVQLKALSEQLDAHDNLKGSSCST